MLRSLFIGLIILSAFTSRGMLLQPWGMLDMHLNITDEESRQDNHDHTAFGVQNSAGGSLPSNEPDYYVVKTYTRLQSAGIFNKEIKYKSHFEVSYSYDRVGTGSTIIENIETLKQYNEPAFLSQVDLTSSGLSPPGSM